MDVHDLRDRIRSAPPLAPDDTVAKAVRLLRARELPALPIAESGRLIGIVHEGDLISLIASLPDPRAAASTIKVSQVGRPIRSIVSESQSLLSVAESLRDPHESAPLVVGSDGRYLGLLLRRDVLSAMAGEPVMPAIAGLATPFGVYLTTGALRAGAGDLALAATGAALMVINLLANGIIYGIGWSLQQLLPVAPASQVPPPTGNPALAIALIVYGMQMGLFLLLLRLSPLTGIHAAEHMVVHTIEEGEDVTLEKVRTMPRVHPRCGTNLMALLILLLIAQQFFAAVSTADEATRVMALFVLVLIVLITWRRLGAGLQRWVTTRRPSDRQLAHAIAVGERLLAEVRAHPSARVSAQRRMWNIGFVQVMAGFLLVTVVVDYAGPFILKLWPRLVG